MLQELDDLMAALYILGFQYPDLGELDYEAEEIAACEVIRTAMNNYHRERAVIVARQQAEITFENELNA